MTTASTSKLGVCGTCLQQPALYTCPACSLATCSLACSRAHKLTLPCSGQRKPQWSQPLTASELGEWGPLKRDQAYLAGLGRVVEGEGRKMMDQQLIPKSHGGRTFADSRIDGWSDKELGLLQAAQKEGVDLQLLPKGMSRRVKNASRRAKDGSLEWTTEFFFRLSPTPSTSSVLVPLTSSSVHLAKLLHTAVNMRKKPKGKGKAEEKLPEVAWVEAELAKLEREGRLAGSPPPGDEEADKVAAPAFVLTLALPSIASISQNQEEEAPEPSTSASIAQRVIALEPSQSLRAALLNTTILEFPSLTLWSSAELAKAQEESKVQVVLPPTRPPSSLESSGGRGGRGGWRGRGGGRGGGTTGRVQHDVNHENEEDHTAVQSWSSGRAPAQDSGWGSRGARAAETASSGGGAPAAATSEALPDLASVVPSSGEGDRCVKRARVEGAPPEQRAVPPQLPVAALGLGGIVDYGSDESD